MDRSGSGHGQVAGSCECSDKISGLTTSIILEEKLPILHLPDVTMKVTY